MRKLAAAMASADGTGSTKGSAEDGGGRESGISAAKRLSQIALVIRELELESFACLSGGPVRILAFFSQVVEALESRVLLFGLFRSCLTHSSLPTYTSPLNSTYPPSTLHYQYHQSAQDMPTQE